jgi:hypothetical protein
MSTRPVYSGNSAPAQVAPGCNSASGQAHSFDGPIWTCPPWPPCRHSCHKSQRSYPIVQERLTLSCRVQRGLRGGLPHSVRSQEKATELTRFGWLQIFEGHRAPSLHRSSGVDRGSSCLRRHIGLPQLVSSLRRLAFIRRPSDGGLMGANLLLYARWGAIAASW